MTSALENPPASAHRAAGIDIDAADSGLRQIVARLKATWPAAGAPGAVKLDIGSAPPCVGGYARG
jgi:hypothetical protein